MSPKSDLSPYDPRRGGRLRVSKSSFMTYLQCPRKFFFNYMALYDIDTPRSDAMIRGTAIHNVMELAIPHAGSVEGYEQAVLDTAMQLDDADPTSALTLDEGVSELGVLLAALADDGMLDVISLEERIEAYDDENDCTLVGAIDGLFRHPDGGVMIVELKTGNLNSTKLSKYRKELAFYRRLLIKAGRYTEDELTHYVIIAPDCTDEKLVTSLLGQKRQSRDVFLGNVTGLAIVEPISSRSVTGLERDLERAVEGIKTHDFPTKWNDYFCTQWCDYHLSCETELTGGASALTGVFE
jgi:hypothetical protein